MTDDARIPSMRVSAPEQHRALGHPLRQRLLFSLTRQSATTSQLAAALGVAKGSVAHHLRILREAGLVDAAGTRRVRGGTEKYYRRTALRLDIDDPTGESARAAFTAFADEFTAAEDPLLILRHLRLTPDQAARLTAALTEITESVTDDGPDQQRYGLVVGMYRQSAPPPAASG